VKPFTHVPDVLKKRLSTGDSSKRLFCFLRSRTTSGYMGCFLSWFRPLEPKSSIRDRPSSEVSSGFGQLKKHPLGLHGLHVRKHRSREHPPFGSSHLSSRDGANFGQPMVKSCPQERESKPFGKSRSLWEREQGSGCRETGKPPFTLFAAYGETN
jgi:hypothetical protein